MIDYIRLEEIKMRLYRVEDRIYIDRLTQYAAALQIENRIYIDKLTQFAAAPTQKQAIEDGWRHSPDRMGGQFSDEEILDSYRNKW